MSVMIKTPLQFINSMSKLLLVMTLFNISSWGCLKAQMKGNQSKELMAQKKKAHLAVEIYFRAGEVSASLEGYMEALKEYGRVEQEEELREIKQSLNQLRQSAFVSLRSLEKKEVFDHHLIKAQLTLSRLKAKMARLHHRNPYTAFNPHVGQSRHKQQKAKDFPKNLEAQNSKIPDNKVLLQSWTKLVKEVDELGRKSKVYHY